MKRIFANAMSALVVVSVLAGTAMMAGCTAPGNKTFVTYDLGPLPSAPPATSRALPPITVADVTSAGWLDSPMMFYRLDYANDLQPRPYANSRWSMTPPQLLGQRIESRLAQNGGVVLAGSDGAVNVPVLRIEAVDFSQRFADPGQSDVYVGMRATVLNGRTLVAQKSFENRLPAPSPDAAGAARALADATDLMINDLMTWLTSLPVKK